MFVGKKDMPPRLASLQRLLQALKADEIVNGKKVTLGGCVVCIFYICNLIKLFNLILILFFDIIFLFLKDSTQAKERITFSTGT
jgi:hypothetical protein